MKVLVTGADGFVGRRLVDVLIEAGHDVTAAVRPGATPPRRDVPVVALELRERDSVHAAVAPAWDWIAHLAAVASNADALADPGLAWDVNAAGTARLLGELGRQRQIGRSDARVLLVSTAEVYDAHGAAPLAESAPLRPRSPYAASKRGAELAAEETAGRTGLAVIVARPFPHTGPGQDERFATAAFARRLLDAKQSGARTVRTGNLSPVRDLLDVRDVVQAYVALLANGRSGEIYNVASGRGVSMAELFARLAAVVGVSAEPVPDPALVRSVDTPYLVGDAGKLTAATGWRPAIDLDTTLADLVHAQAN